MHLARAAICVGLCLGLAGCRGSVDDRPVLHIANWGVAGDDEFNHVFNDIIATFERENQVRVEIDNIPDQYVPKLTLSFIAGTEPDIVTLDASSSAIFINNGLLADLAPIIAKDKDFKLDDYFQNVIDIGKRGNSIYHIPNDFTPMVVYYNKRIFDKMHVPYPKNGWTWDEFMDTARKLTIPGPTPSDPPTQPGFAFQNWVPGWIMWLWNNGGDVLAQDGSHATGFLDSPQNVETIRFLSSLQMQHISPNLSQMTAMGIDPFANGKAAMTVSGHWMIPSYKSAPKGPDGKPLIRVEDIGVVMMPRRKGPSQTVMYESGYAIARHCKQKDLAWKFIKYFTSYRVQKIYNSTGIAVCARKDIAQERAKDPLEAEFLPIIPTARPPWGTRVEGYDFVEKQNTDAMAAVLDNGKPIQEALTQAASRIDKEFAKK